MNNLTTNTRRRNTSLIRRAEKKLKSVEAVNLADKTEENKLEKLRKELFALLESNETNDLIDAIELLSVVVEKLALSECELVRSTTANAYLGLNVLLSDNNESVQKTAQVKIKMLNSRT